MARRVIGVGITDDNGVARCPITGQGRGKMQVVAETEFDDGRILSETYGVLDCVYYNPNDLTAETQLNKYFGSEDFCVEWDLKATSRTVSFSYVRLGTDYKNCIQVGHLYSNGASLIRIMQNGSQINGSQAYTVPLDEDLHCKYTRNGNIHTFEIGGNTLSLTDSTYTDLTLLQAVVTDETEDMRNLKVYLI